MPSADCLVAIDGIATAPLQGVVLFVFPVESGLVSRSRRPAHAQGVGQPVPCLSGVVSCRAIGSPGVLPCCFPCVTVRHTRGDITITGGLPIVLHPRPCSSCLYLPTGCQSPIPSTLYDRPACLLPASFNPPLRNESLPSATLRRYLPVTGLAP
jgi:hypothetical protein